MNVDPASADFWIGLGLLVLAALVMFAAPYAGAFVRWFKRETYEPATHSKSPVVRWNAEWEIANAKINAVWWFRGLALLIGAIGLVKVLGA